MKRVFWYGGMGFGIFMFILGFWDLQPSKFGFWSNEMFMGLLIMMGIYFKGVIDNIKEVR